VRAHDGGRNRGKGAHRNYIKGASLLFSSIHDSISISLWLLELLSQVTGCLAQVL